MTDILFGQSYYLRFDPKLWQAMEPYPPLGTLYAASYMRQRGYSVALFDAMLADSETRWDEAIAAQHPRYAVLFEDNFNYLSKMCMGRMRQAALTMIAMARRRGCTVIVGGADATDNAALYLSHGADFVLIGEGEETLGELLDVLTRRSSGSVESIAGLAWADRGNGPREGALEPFQEEPTVRVTAPRAPLRNLDALPMPAWDLVDMPLYRETWRRRHGFFSVNMVTTRGCPYHCNWCAKPIWGQRYNVRSPESVVAELKFLKESFGPDHVWFMDDIMGLTPGWLTRFADLVQAQDARVPFKSLNRADLLLRDNAVEALRRAGARTVWIGAESGSQAVLDAMEKGTRVEQIRSAATQLRAAGIEVGFFLQFGYPGETWREILQTFRLVWDCMPDQIGMSVSYPLPGTRFYERVVDQLGAKRQWEDSSDLAMLYRGPFSTEFYRTLSVALRREFRVRQALAALRGEPSAVRALRGRYLRAAVGSVARALSLPFTWLRLHWLRLRSGIVGGPLHLRPAPIGGPSHPQGDARERGTG